MLEEPWEARDEMRVSRGETVGVSRGQPAPGFITGGFVQGSEVA